MPGGVYRGPNGRTACNEGRVAGGPLDGDQRLSKFR